MNGAQTENHFVNFHSTTVEGHFLYSFSSDNIKNYNNMERYDIQTKEWEVLHIAEKVTITSLFTPLFCALDDTTLLIMACDNSSTIYTYNTITGYLEPVADAPFNLKYVHHVNQGSNGSVIALVWTDLPEAGGEQVVNMRPLAGTYSLSYEHEDQSCLDELHWNSQS